MGNPGVAALIDPTTLNPALNECPENEFCNLHIWFSSMQNLINIMSKIFTYSFNQLVSALFKSLLGT